MAEGNLLPISVFRCSLFSELRWLAFTWGKAAGCCWQLPPPRLGQRLFTSVSCWRDFGGLLG